MNIKRQIERAAKVIKEADAIFITAGLGIGFDSGLPNLRQGDGLWEAYPPAKELNLVFEDMMNPYWFDADPHLAWGFYGNMYKLYQQTQPHKGYEYLYKWALHKGIYFVFTSNVDGHFQKAGFDPNRIAECHGSIHHVQCSNNCKGEIWNASEIPIFLNKETHKAEDPLPACHYCGEPIRPNILMINDLTWNKRRVVTQGNQLHVWHRKVKDFGYKLAIIEIGAGTQIPTIRHESEGTAAVVGGTLIRINPNEPQVPKGHISLPLKALEALEMINEEMNK